MTTPECPNDAWWSDEDQEWVHGVHDDQGRLTGLVRYWDAEGVFISDCEHHEGKPHGRARRFYPDGSVAQECCYVGGVIEGVRTIHRPTSPQIVEPRFESLADAVVVYECVYAGGDLIGTRYRDADGTEVEGNGRPVPARPPGVEETASRFPGGGWVFMRRRGEDGDETLETREYFEDGSLHRERRPDGLNRAFHQGGALRSEGMRVPHENRRPQHGAWRYGDAEGVIRRVSQYEYGAEHTRTWRRTAQEAGEGGAVECTGPVMRVDGTEAAERGRWEFRDASGTVTRTIELGDAAADDALLAHAALRDDVDLEQLRACARAPEGPATTVARLRLAARTESKEALEAFAVPRTPWVRLSRDGQPGAWSRLLTESIHALAFVPLADAIPPLAATLFRADRPRVALDLVDAARLRRDTPDLLELRASYLRALGEDESADAVLDVLDPSRVGAEEQALLLQIRAAPDDDAPRLAYAAYIEPARPDHAALIRADCGGPPVTDREARVEQAFGALPPDLRPSAGDIVRGFESGGALSVTAEDFIAHHDALFRLGPLFEALDLGCASRHVATLATMPALRRYTELSLWDTYLFDGGAAQLARSANLGQLRYLGLCNTNLYDEELICILQSEAFPRLTGLDISNMREGQHYGFQAFRRLARAPFAPTLGSLTMSRRYFGPEIVSVLARLPSLHALDVEGSNLGRGVVELAALDRRWTSLDLRRSGIDADGAQALAGSPSVDELTSLWIGSNPLGDRGVVALVGSDRLGRVQTLSMGGGARPRTRASAVLGRAMRRAAMAESLTTLELSLAALGAEGAEALAEAPLRRLSRLNLHNNQVGDEGASALARSPHLEAMRHLDLSGNGIGDAGALALAESATFKGLTWLELGGAELSTKAREALVERFGDKVQFEYPWGRR